MYKKIPMKWIKPLNENRLLIVSVNANGIKYSSRFAELRNRYIAKQAEKVVFGNSHNNSSLYPMYQELIEQERKIEVLDFSFSP